ncbi:MAG: response regulator [Magnetococcus sp. YQC-5]
MTDTPAKSTILVVDDTPGNLDLVKNFLVPDYSVQGAINGPMALKIAAKQPPDLILLDVMMPEMDGFEVCERLKSNPVTQDIPVVFITARTAQEDVSRGLSLGATYYLTKPLEPQALKIVVSVILKEVAIHRNLIKNLQNTANSICLLANGQFHFRTVDEACQLATLVSRACPNPEKQLIGLKELMINAVEHGNLGITYQEKSHLMQTDSLDQEIEDRLNTPFYAARKGTILFQQNSSDIKIVIKDEGEGFDWEPYLVYDPARIFDLHGRGIAMSKHSAFDCLNYQGCGNEVHLVLYKGRSGEHGVIL